jgi:hypothetical protein
MVYFDGLYLLLLCCVQEKYDKFKTLFMHCER